MMKSAQRLVGFAFLLIVSSFVSPCAHAQGLGPYAAGINYPAGPPTIPTNTGYWLGGISPVEIHSGYFSAVGKFGVIAAASCGYSYGSFPACTNNGSLIVVYLSNGDGTFSAPIVSSGNIPPLIRSIAVGDFDGDGNLDVAAAADCLSYQDCSSGTITILHGNGDGTFSSLSQYPLNGMVGQSGTVAVGEFNGDGKLDLAVGIACYIPLNGCMFGAVSIYLGNGDGTLASPTYYRTAAGGTLSPVVGDFNSDGWTDVIAGGAVVPGDNIHSTLTVLLNKGDGTGAFINSGQNSDGSFIAPVPTFSAGTLLTFGGLSALASADFNGDGKADLAITTSLSSIQILSGNGDGTFGSPIPISTALTNVTTNITAIGVTDLNHDGKPDLVISGTDPITGTNGAQLFLNDGTGNFAGGPAYGLGGSEFAPIVVEDFNGDGNLDVVLASTISGQQGGEGSLSILLGNGDATLQGATILNQTLGSVYAAISADVNGDGIPDLIESVYVPAYGDQGGILVYLGTGNGQYAAPILYTAGASTARALVAVDFNKDGKLDIAVVGTCFDSSCTEGGVNILLGNGDGTFQSPVPYRTGDQYSLSLVAGDFNGDKQLDIAVMNQLSSVSILLGNGDGTLRQPAVVAVTSPGSQNLSIAAADFNNDGNTDIALDYIDPSSGGSVQVFLGGANGSLSPAGTPYASGGSGALNGVSVVGGSLAIADVNRDGNLDIVIANQCQSGDSGCSFGSLAVLNGNGDGTFQIGPVQSVPDGGFYSLLLADVNGDGILDAVASDPTGVELLLGKSDGSFLPPIAYAGARNAGQNTTVALADLNIIQPGAGNGSTAVFINRAGTYLVSKSSTNPSPGGQSVQLTTTVSPSYLTGLTPTGSISYSDGTTSLGSAALVGGVASFNIPAGLSQGVHTITPYYSGDSNFSAHYGTSLLQVVAGGTGIPTATTVVAPAITYGAAANVTVGVTSGQGTVTGNVALTVDNASPLTQVLSGGSTVFTISGLAAGSHSLIARYTAQGSFAASSATATQTVNQASSNIVLASSGSPTIWGQNVSFTAAITPQNGGVATGTVTFNDGATVLATANVAGNGAAFSTTTLGTGTHSVTATYSGDSNVAGSSSSAISQMVNQSTTTAKLASSANPSYLGQAVTFIAIVTGQQGGAVSGNVAFKQGATTVATVGLVSGQAAYSTTYTTAGTRSMTVVYAGDSNNLGSTSAALKQVVKSLPAATTTQVVTSGSPSLINQGVTFTATISSTYGIPDNETVTFYNGATAIGTGTTAGGVATFQTSSLTAKTHTIKATYAGDATFKSSSGTVTQVVSLYTATVTLTASPNPSAYGQLVGLIATVTSGAPGGPTGTVTFKNGSSTLGTTPTTAGTALLATTKLPVGSDAVTATYNGDAQDGKITSAPFTQTVSQAMINMTLTSSPNPSTFGKSVKFTATLTSNGSLPNGNGQVVTFSYNSTNLGTGNISGGKAVFSTTTLPSGSDGVTATYAGSADYSPASASVTQTVN
jgi:hypothetical protein